MSSFPALVGQRQLSSSNSRFLKRFIIFAVVCGVLSSTVPAQVGLDKPAETSVAKPDQEDLSPVAAKVDVKPVARDEEIRQRLQQVLLATDWFTAPQVRVEQGVVFLNGRAPSSELKQWAGDLARKTEGVVAVVNQMKIAEPSFWDFQPAWKGFLALWRDFIRSIPLFLIGLIILAMSVQAGLLATHRAGSFFAQRIQANLLRTVIARGIGVLVFLLGTYIVLKVSGLTQLALTVVGGTGLIGLVLGIAFRDITENFLASIFLSMQRPFEMGDLVEVSGLTGYVQQLNVRTTVLMTLEGHLVQIPNASVYKSNIRNFTTNANRREDFVVGIGYEDSISEAQEIARKVLSEHPAVLKEPEPFILADSLGKATVNLRVYFWINGRQHSWLKVKSAAIRLVKRAFQQNGISMPDEAREVVFPEGVPLRRAKPDVSPPKPLSSEPASHETDAVATKGEGSLSSEEGQIKQQAKDSGLQEGENLLSGPKDPSAEG